MLDTCHTDLRFIAGIGKIRSGPPFPKRSSLNPRRRSKSPDLGRPDRDVKGRGQHQIARALTRSLATYVEVAEDERELAAVFSN